MGRNGKSRALICFVLCMIMALPVYFSSAVAVKAAEQQTIVIGTNAEYSPFEYLDGDRQGRKRKAGMEGYAL